MYVIIFQFNDSHYTEFKVSEERLNRFKSWITGENTSAFHIVEDGTDYYVLKNNIKYVKIAKYTEEVTE